MPVFIQLVSESFTEPNRNPLDPARWTTVIEQGNITPLQIVSNTCRGTNTTTGNAEKYIGISWPDNQWIEFKIQNLVEEVVSLYLRLSADQTNAYEFDIIDNGGGTATVGISFLDGGDILFENDTLAWKNGDVFRAAVVGHTLLFYQNGNLIGQATDTTLSSGSPFIEIDTDDLTAATLVNFAGGMVSPDPSLITVSSIFIQDNAQKTQTFSGTLTIENGFYPQGGIALDSVLLATLQPTTNQPPISVILNSLKGTGYIYQRIPSTGNLMILQVPQNGSLKTAAPLSEISSATGSLSEVSSDVIQFEAVYRRNA